MRVLYGAKYLAHAQKRGQKSNQASWKVPSSVPRAAVKDLQHPPTTASAAAPTAVDSHCQTHFNDSPQSAGDILEQREQKPPGRGRARGSGGRGWGDYLRGRGGGARSMNRRENRQGGSGGREGMGRGVSRGRRGGELAPRPSGEHRQSNAKMMQGFSSEVRAGQMAEAGRAGKQERETVRENWGEDNEELSGGESLDDRMEKLGRYLSANLNFEPDVEEYDDDGGFMLDGCDDMPPLEGADGTLVLEGGLSYPASSATVAVAVKVEEPCLLSGGQYSTESPQVGRSEEKPAVLLLSEEDEDVDQFEDLCEQFDDGPGHFDDGVGLFGNGVVSSATSDCILPHERGCGDSGKGEEWEREGEDSGDDGWISDPEENENLFRFKSGMAATSFWCVCW